MCDYVLDVGVLRWTCEPFLRFVVEIDFTTPDQSFLFAGIWHCYRLMEFVVYIFWQGSHFIDVVLIAQEIRFCRHRIFEGGEWIYWMSRSWMLFWSLRNFFFVGIETLVLENGYTEWVGGVWEAVVRGHSRGERVQKREYIGWVGGDGEAVDVRGHSRGGRVQKRGYIGWVGGDGEAVDVRGHSRGGEGYRKGGILDELEVIEKLLMWGATVGGEGYRKGVILDE